MSFLTSADHNLVMDLGLPVDVLKRLHDAGATAAIEFVDWPAIEPARGVYDWTTVDGMIDRCRAAGLKAILIGLREVPAWMPDDWCVRGPSGRIYRATVPEQSQVVWGHLSPWHPEAMEYLAQAARAFCAHVAAPDTCAAAALGRDMEALIPQHYTTLCDEHALASYRAYTGDARGMPSLSRPETQTWLFTSLSAYAVEQQRVFLAQSHRTIFTALHPAYEIFLTPMHRGEDYVHDLAYHLRPDQLAVFVWDYYSDGTERSWMPAARHYARVVRERDGARVWTGSEWSAGLLRNTSRAIEEGFSGFITAPLHPLIPGKTRVEEWEYDAFRFSHDLFAQAREAVHA